MTSSNDFLRAVGTLALSLTAASTMGAQDPVTITSADMFNKIGQYYRAYASRGKVTTIRGEALSTILARKGSDVRWDFTAGPTNDVYRYDYVAVTDGGFGQEFPQAKFAERLTIENRAGDPPRLYLEQVPGIGRKVYGYTAPPAFLGQLVEILGLIGFFGQSEGTPIIHFEDPFIDFPERIRYGDTWTSSTSYQMEFPLTDTQPDPDDPGAPPETFVLPFIFRETTTYTVDAFGPLELPGVAFDDALRVNALTQKDIEVDSGGGNFEPGGTQFSRSYFWLRPGLGIAAQITSEANATPPPDNFNSALSFVRLFESNHPKGEGELLPVGITGLKITLANGRLLIGWNKVRNSSSYRVEYTTNPGLEPWVRLGETSSDFIYDSVSKNSTARFYRIVGVE